MFGTHHRKIAPNFSPALCTISVSHPQQDSRAVAHNAEGRLYGWVCGGPEDKDVYLVDIKFKIAVLV
jgi:hypothetical protein